MVRDYKSINNEIAVSGFFSEYLPPCFKINKKFLQYAPKQNCDLIKPVSFTMSRFNINESRRIISIPEIGAYSVLYNYIKNNDILQEIVEFCDSVDRSFSRILGPDNTIMKHEQVYDENFEVAESSSTNYINNIIEKIKKASGAKKILKLDISNCYSSFYMHIIPTILLGVEQTECNYKKFCEDPKDTSIDPVYNKYKELDAIMRHQNLNQTNGLLVGPQYSKIISEGILTRIDKELEKHNVCNYVRYVDDYEVFLVDDNEKRIISIFEEVLKKYGFTLNNEKTEIIDFPYYVSYNLERIFKDRMSESLTDDEVLGLFNTFFELESQGVKGAIRFLLKSIETTKISVDDTELFKAYLLTIIRNNERSLTKACSILIENKESIKLSKSDILIIDRMIERCIENKNDLEVIWLLYLLIETNNICFEDRIIERIFDRSNELVKTMLLRKDLLTSELKDRFKIEANTWLALYELYSMELIDEECFVQRLGIKKNLEVYKKLKKNDLHFVYQ